VDGEIRIGTSGWSYPSGNGTWNGIFYPAPRPRGFDELRYYAERFDTVELNSSFYRVPDPVMVAKWISRTPPGFQFSVKLYQKFTHPEMYLARGGVSDWNLAAGDFDEVRAGLDPLAEARRLAAVLLQFPPSFHAGPDTRAYLDWLLDALGDYPLAVELRHASWTQHLHDTRTLLAEHKASWVSMDLPKVAGAGLEIDRETSLFSTPLYLRLHGRNSANWWKHEKSEDRYNYLYSREELVPFADTARRAARAGRRVLLYMNNHFSAKAVANAVVLKHELDQLVPGDYSQEMVRRYPELTGVVATSGLPL
jgi:uncharacterized protein YecE (DUF72 family)